ncbi:uncharacterized protein LOC133188828 [Saccostrea echinata]|uniref:uncharacterized protein LOC133188828 n=1 Tax=Saccostrea echinata TaxID=191078 RepID=UPI002A8011A6|nr:uncharacterized protein LOC133188828 [Saccostrea echinata]
MKALFWQFVALSPNLGTGMPALHSLQLSILRTLENGSLGSTYRQTLHSLGSGWLSSGQTLLLTGGRKLKTGLPSLGNITVHFWHHDTRKWPLMWFHSQDQEMMIVFGQTMTQNNSRHCRT